MIVSFADKETERIWNRQFSRKLPTEIQETALNRLRLLNAADLKIWPSRPATGWNL
jgi:proteic killer suppression protein